jgi:hypothetical protein
MVYGFDELPPGVSWSEGSTHGQWRDEFNGYGATGTEIDGSRVLSESPQAASSSGETHAALVTTLAAIGDLDFTVRLRTVAQLRTPAPNPWEVGWVLWHYTDNSHFYYLMLKPNGWELGKEDPAYPDGQRFLATSSSPAYPIGGWHAVHVRQVGDDVTAWADGVQLVSFVDAERPYGQGAIGLYDEDAHVHFGDVQVAPGS